MIKTTAVLCWSWSRFGQLTRRSSPRTSRANSMAPPKRRFFLSCALPLPAPRLLAIISSPDLVIKSRAGGTRTPDLRFWRPLLYQLSYCPLPIWSPGAPYAVDTTGNISSTVCGPGCSAGSYGCCSSGAYTPRMPALPIVAQRSSKSQGRDETPRPHATKAYLLHYFGDDAGAHRPAALADGEVQPLVHRYGTDQLHVHHRVVPGHHHLHPLLEPYLPRHVRRPKVELRPVVGEERRVTPPLLLGEHVHLGLELGVRRDRPRLGQHLPPLDVVALDPPQERAYVVPGLRPVHRLVAHLTPGHHRAPRGPDADDLHLLVEADLPSLHAPRGHRAPSLDREHVLHRQEEGTVHRPLGLGHVGVYRLHQLHDRLFAVLPLVPLQGPQGAPHDHGDVVAREVVLGQELPNLHLHQLQELGVVDHVRLVQEHHDVGHPHLASQQDVLPRLGHGAVGSTHHQDRPIHLGGPGDHVLDVVGVPRAVHVRVVPILGGVLLVGSRYGDPALALLGGVVDLLEVDHLVGRVVGDALGQHAGYRGGEGGLAVVDVAYGAHVQVRLVPLEPSFGHSLSPTFPLSLPRCSWA